MRRSSGLAAAAVAVFLGACQATPAPRPARPVARPAGRAVLLRLPTAPRVTAPACPDALPAGVPRRVGDGLAEALRAAGFTVVEDAAAPHGFVAVVDVEVRYCNADVGLVNGVVGLDLQRAGVRVRQSVAEGELSTPSPVASIARDVVDVLIHDSAVIAAVDAAGAGG